MKSIPLSLLSLAAGATLAAAPEAAAQQQTYTGENDRDRFGDVVCGVDDVTGDGRPDILVGASANDAGGTDAGRAYLYSGIDESLDRVIDGSADNDQCGLPVAGAAFVHSGSDGDLLSVDQPVYADTTVHLSVAGATPGAEQRLVYSCEGKGHSFSHVTGVTIALNQPRLLGSVMADGSGDASWTAVAPSSLVGVEFRVQAVEVGNRTQAEVRVIN